jgi:putative tricarboxylic transport membrane protein
LVNWYYVSGNSRQSVAGRFRGEWVAVAGWLLLGIVVLIAAAPLPTSTQFGPGPGFFPRYLCAALLGLVAIRAFCLVRGLAETEEGGGALPGRAGVVRFLLIAASLFAYDFMLERHGFALATAALSWAILVLLGRRPIRAFIESLVAAFVLRYAFSTLLDVPLPGSSIAILQSLGL